MDNIVNQGTVVKLICELLDHSQKPVLRKKTRKTLTLCSVSTRSKVSLKSCTNKFVSPCPTP